MVLRSSQLTYVYRAVNVASQSAGAISCTHTLIDLHCEALIARCNIKNPFTSSHINCLPDSALLSIDGSLIRTVQSIAHSASKCASTIRSDLECFRQAPSLDVTSEPSSTSSSIYGSYPGSAVVALLDADVAVCRVIVTRLDLGLCPSGWYQRPSLNTACERYWFWLLFQP